MVSIDSRINLGQLIGSTVTIVAVVLITFYSLSAKVDVLELQVEMNKNEIQELQQITKSIPVLMETLNRVDKNVDNLVQQQKQRDKEILEFYKNNPNLK